MQGNNNQNSDKFALFNASKNKGTESLTSSKHSSRMKSVSFTPSPHKSFMQAGGFSSSKFSQPSFNTDIDSFEAIVNSQSNNGLISLQSQVDPLKKIKDNINSTKTQEISSQILTRTPNPKKFASMSQKMTVPGESLSYKMSNFVKNYDDLIGMFSNNSSSFSTNISLGKEKSSPTGINIRNSDNFCNIKGKTTNMYTLDEEDDVGGTYVPKMKSVYFGGDDDEYNNLKPPVKKNSQSPHTLIKRDSGIKASTKGNLYPLDEEHNSSVEHSCSEANHIGSLVTMQERKKSTATDLIPKPVELTNEETEPQINNNTAQEEDNPSQVKSLTNTEDIKDFYEYTEECMRRILKLKMPEVAEIQHLMFDLPENLMKELETKKLAIFDLDETLVHAEIKKPNEGDVQIKVKLPNGGTQKIGLNIRPFIEKSLTEIQKDYVIIVYTASHQSYADSVLNYIDPDNKFIQYRLYRHNCVKVQMESDFIYVKDLRIFKSVPIEDMVMIDNSVLSFAFHLENGIPILPYYNNPDDYELKALTNYLTSIANVDDLREENRRRIKMDYFLQSVKDDEALEEEFVEEDSTAGDGLFSLNFCGNNNNPQNVGGIVLQQINHSNSNVGDTSMASDVSMTMDKSEPQTPKNVETQQQGFALRTCGGQSSLSSFHAKHPTRRHTMFKDQLYSTLEDLKHNFTRINEKKKSLYDNGNNK
jgi:Dullard-like phosphatase family protein